LKLIVLQQYFFLQCTRDHFLHFLFFPLENWQEFNAAMIMALLGRSRKLPTHVPKPYQVMLENDNNSAGITFKSSFFKKPRWERKEQQETQHFNDNGADTDNNSARSSGEQASPSMQP